MNKCKPNKQFYEIKILYINVRYGAGMSEFTLKSIRGKALTVNDLQSQGIIPQKEENDDSSIFNRINNTVSDKNSEILNEQLKKVQDNNGCFSSLWNGVKVAAGAGISDKKCDEVIEAYKNGEIDFHEAEQKIKEYSTKQEESLNLFSNIASSVAALGVTALAASAIAATGGAATPFVLAAIGAGAGAATKAGFKLIDRASNNIEGDALDAKEIIKDSLSGAITGSIATVTMGTASTAPTIGSAIISCGKTGIKTGAVSCGANYVIDCTFDEDKKFKAGEFAQNTIEGAIVGGTVGAVMGGANSSMHSLGLLKSGCSFKNFAANAGKTKTEDVTANSVCTAEYKILNDRISDAVA